MMLYVKTEKNSISIWIDFWKQFTKRVPQSYALWASVVNVVVASRDGYGSLSAAVVTFGWGTRWLMTDKTFHQLPVVVNLLSTGSIYYRNIFHIDLQKTRSSSKTLFDVSFGSIKFKFLNLRVIFIFMYFSWLLKRFIASNDQVISETS